MQFKTLVAVAFASLAAAQDQAGFQSEAAAYFSSLVADPSFIQQVEGIATVDPALIGSLQALATPVTDVSELETPPAILTQLPSPYNSLLGSVYSHELSIASAHGLLGGSATSGPVTSGPTATATISATAPAGNLSTSATATGTSPIATAAAPIATGNSAVLAMGAVIGVVGGVAALL